MAHFARIDDDGIVQQVTVINNDICLDDEGNESETVGIEFLQETFGADTQWVQTSYNAATNGCRGMYASIGDVWTGTEFVPANQGESA